MSTIPISMLWNPELTVPLMETMIVPIREPKRSPADIVKGIAGIARIYIEMNQLETGSMKIQKP